MSVWQRTGMTSRHRSERFANAPALIPRGETCQEIGHGFFIWLAVA